MEDQLPVVTEFLNKHYISGRIIDTYDAMAIRLLEGATSQIQNSFDEDKHAFGWLFEISQLMLARVAENVTSAIVLLLGLQFSGTEILARTTVESAVNLMFILQKESLPRLLRYLAFYTESEQRQNDLWKKVSAASSLEEQEIYGKYTRNKDEVIEVYRAYLHAAAKSMMVDYPSDTSWPSIYDRFKAIGKELNYRTLYASLSSQVHNDAEDTLNRLMAQTVEGSESTRAQLLQDTRFSRQSVLSALQYYIEACICLAETFDMHEVARELQGMDEEVTDGILALSLEDKSTVASRVSMNEI